MIMGKNFEGKVVIVTGGGSGIGQATAILYAAHGASVIVSDVNEKGGADTVKAITDKGGQAIFVKADVSKPSDCENLVAETIKKYGKLDVAFNNAGIGGEANLIADMSIEGWSKIIAVNLSSVFYCMKYEIAAMLKHGKGAIVNMSSILGSVGFASSAGYVAAKHGVVGLMDDNMKKALAAMHPIGRLGEPNEVAELVVWLSSDKASFVTGSYYPVDGGYLAV